MKVDDLKLILEARGFKVVEGELHIRMSNGYESLTPLFGVEVSSSHRCIDPDCHGVHPIGTPLVIERMSPEALQAMVFEELMFNR